MSRPIISVLMSVYNSKSYIEEAIDSILNQTFQNFEFIIIDDGSTDGTSNILNKYADQDKRIKLISHIDNKGLPHSLNEGIRLAGGKFIARMDADDISLPYRLEKQLTFFSKHIDVDVVSSYLGIINGGLTSIRRYPLLHKDIVLSMLFSNPLAHPAVMMKSDLIKDYLYNENFLKCQDYELWIRLLGNARFQNIPEALVSYRQKKDSSLTIQQYNLYFKKAQGSWYKKFNLKWSENEYELINSLIHTGNTPDKQYAYKSWFLKITDANYKYRILPQIAFKKLLLIKIFRRYRNVYGYSGPAKMLFDFL